MKMETGPRLESDQWRLIVRTAVLLIPSHNMVRPEHKNQNLGGKPAIEQEASGKELAHTAIINVIALCVIQHKQ